MTRSMPIIEARRRLTSLPEEFAQESEMDAVAVTRRGKPVLAIMPWELYDAIIETLEVMGDETLMSALRQSAQEAAQGETIPWDTVKRDLNL